MPVPIVVAGPELLAELAQLRAQVAEIRRIAARGAPTPTKTALRRALTL